MEPRFFGDASSSSLSPSHSLAWKSSADVSPLREDADLPAESFDGRALCVVSLNLGGRNTNPVEFELKGDASEAAVEAMAILRKACRALRSAQDGPLLLPAPEAAAVQEILAEIFQESVDEVPSEDRSRIQHLLRCETWAQLLASVRVTSPRLFNAFSRDTLKLNRPSVWENPASCKDFANTKEYLAAWKHWFCSLDRTSEFWLQDAPRVANQRGLEVPTAFAGLLLFDLMSLCTARRSLGGDDGEEAGVGGIAEDGREVPFREIAGFAERLPASSLAAQHAAARGIAEGAHALLVQEDRSFADHPTIADKFLPPFYAFDGFTAIFLRKDAFKEATDITAAVVKRMDEFIDELASEELQRAWRTSASRLAAVCCECHPQLGGFQACLVSLHISKSSHTAGFLLKLRDALASYDVEINIVGMDSNCAATEVSAFQRRLWNAGFDIGCSPKQQQVTVAKQRTAFQTQTQKVGDIDISHKDYILSWTSPRVRRGRTSYTPDLRTPYGVEQETKQCVRLPMAKWPFDHCSVATSFRPRSTLAGRIRCRCSWHLCYTSALVLLVLLVLASPLASADRSSPYGRPGRWFHDGWIFTPRFGICEAPAPCPEAEGWLRGDVAGAAAGSCYMTTPQLGYPDVERFCEEHGGAPITIGSEAENQLVVQSLCPQNYFCYIGLLGDFTGESRWASGEALQYNQLVPIAQAFLPLYEASRSTDYTITLLSNLPGHTSGCDVRYAFSFQGGSAAALDEISERILPALAMVWSGLLLVQRRPRGQRLASALLLMAFSVNFPWAWHKMFNACFVDDFYTHLAVEEFGNNLLAGGHTAISMLGLWMIVRRMCVLYPSEAFKQLFWLMIAGANIFFTCTALFVDPRAPFGATWAVVLAVCSCVLVSVLYVALAVKVSRNLHRTWAFLRKEATSGCSTEGTTLSEQVRAAKVHLFAVPCAIMTGAARWAVLVALIVGLMYPGFSKKPGNVAYIFVTFLDSITNDFCAHVLALLNMDGAVVRAKGVTAAVAERAEREVEQHRLAVRMLKAAPTSLEQLQQFKILEGKAIAALGTAEEKHAFLILQSAVRVESARIHRLMHCVRIRAMTMRMRYQYLIEVPALEGSPRQHVPAEFELAAEEKGTAAAGRYLDWLYSEADGAQQVLFQQLQNLLAKFNRAIWPSDLGLTPEEFPWRVWASSNDVGMKRLRDSISPGDTLVHAPARKNCFSSDRSALCVVLEEMPSGRALVHRSGVESSEQVPLEELRTSPGGCVFIPGPRKKRQRSLDKIAADYQDSGPWPGAARLLDVCRCMVLCDDPYAAAVLVAYLRRTVEVLRVKNRFAEDDLELYGAEELQSIFNAASGGSDAAVSETQTSISATATSADRQYRDVNMNVVVRTPSGVPFVCEVQVTLSSLAILKRADQGLYAVRRMSSPGELSSGGGRTFAQGGEASKAEVGTALNAWGAAS